MPRTRAFNAHRTTQVTSYTLSLHEVDTVQNSLELSEFVPSTIETMVRQGHIDSLADPLVVTLLNHKWSQFGAAMYLAQLCSYIAFLIVQTFVVWMHNHGVSKQASRTTIEPAFAGNRGLIKASHTVPLSNVINAQKNSQHNTRDQKKKSNDCDAAR